MEDIFKELEDNFKEMEDVLRDMVYLMLAMYGQVTKRGLLHQSWDFPYSYVIFYRSHKTLLVKNILFEFVFSQKKEKCS